MKCKSCGNEGSTSAVFCEQCGARFSDPPPARKGEVVMPSDAEQPEASDGPRLRGAGARALIWGGVLLLAALAFFISMLIYPVVIVALGIPAVLAATNFKGLGDRVVKSWLWRHWRLPWATTVTPVVGAVVLGVWVAGTSVSGYAMYSHQAAVQAQHDAEVRLTSTAVVIVHKTAVASLHATATEQAIAHRTTTAVAKVRATRTARLAVLKAHAQATRQAQMRRTAIAAAPGKTAAASAHATNQAVARANANATSQAQVAADSQATTDASTLLDISGSGIHSTQEFTTNGNEWQLIWSYDCSSFGSSGNFIVDINDSSGLTGSSGVNELGSSGSGTEYEHQGGTFYLDINSECDWQVSVHSP